MTEVLTHAAAKAWAAFRMAKDVRRLKPSAADLRIWLLFRYGCMSGAHKLPFT